MHTKGPWRAIGKGGTSDGGSTKQHPCFNGYIVGGNNQTVIQQHTTIGVKGRTPEEAEANARLIAAAPELLEACQAALLTLNINRERVTCPPLVEKLRAAIQKATGGQ